MRVFVRVSRGSWRVDVVREIVGSLPGAAARGGKPWRALLNRLRSVRYCALLTPQQFDPCVHSGPPPSADGCEPDVESKGAEKDEV